MTRDERIKQLGDEAREHQLEELKKAEKRGLGIHLGPDNLTIFAVPADRCCGYCNEAYDWSSA